MSAEEAQHIKVSIVVPIYNSAPYLDKLIQSIQAQTHSNIEPILVDDGSPDNSGVICDCYAAQDPRIIVVHQPNKGCCEARNTGLRHMTGEWFTFVDGDDWIEPDYVEYLLNLAISMDAEMAVSNSVFTSRDRMQNEKDFLDKWTPEMASSKIVQSFGPIGCFNKIYNTAMWRESGVLFAPLWGGEGVRFASLVAQHTNWVAKGHRRIYNYRINNPSSGLTSNNILVGMNCVKNYSDLRHCTTIRTPMFMHALEWRMWGTYRLLLRTIIANHAQLQHLGMYLYSRLMIRLLLPSVLLHRQFGSYSRKLMIGQAILPDYFARKELAEKKQRLEIDLLNPQL